MPEFVKLTGIAVLGAGSLILLVMAHLVLFAAAEAALIAAGIAGVRFLRRFTLVVHDVPEPAAAEAVPAALLASPRQALAAPPLHLHFHGVTAEDAAAITRRQVMTARPAIEEKS